MTNAYNLFSYDGTLLGDTFADNARQAVLAAATQGYPVPVVYAREPRLGGR